MSGATGGAPAFDRFQLAEPIRRAVRDAGFTTPTPIQQAAIPVALEGRDILATAQTGTGKTAAFTLPMIHRLSGGRARARMPRALVLEPVRELALQVQEQIDLFSAHVSLSSDLFIGGVNIAPQAQRAAQPLDILIATPGRLLDLFDRGALLLIGVEFLVIDEADRMLDMGFIPAIESIAAKLPAKRQTMMLSATMPPEIGQIAKRFLRDPERISVAPPAATADMVDQSVIHCGARDKDRVLGTLLANPAIDSALVFCNRKRTVDELVRTLRRSRVQVDALHGDMPQQVRLRTMEAFRSGEIRVLIATDVAGRGLDVRGISHVFNYEVPHQAEDYVHHIGRTGRAGVRGTSITLASAGEREDLEAIEKLINLKIPVRRMNGKRQPPPPEAAAKNPSRATGTARKKPRVHADPASEPPHPLAHILAPARRPLPAGREPGHDAAPTPGQSSSWSETFRQSRRREPDRTPAAAPSSTAPPPRNRAARPAPARPASDPLPAPSRPARRPKFFTNSDDVPAFLQLPATRSR